MTPTHDDIATLVADEYLVSGERQCFPAKDRYLYLKEKDLLNVKRYPSLTGVEFVQEDVIRELSAELAAALSADFPRVSGKFETEFRTRMEEQKKATADTSGTLQCYEISIRGAFASQGANRFDKLWERFYSCRGDNLTVGLVGCLATGFKQTARSGAISQFEQAAKAALEASVDLSLVTADVKAKIQKAVQRGMTRKEEFSATVPDTFFVYGIRKLTLPSDAADPDSGNRCIPGTVKVGARSKEQPDAQAQCERSIDSVSRPGADPRSTVPQFNPAAKLFTWSLAKEPPLDCLCSGYLNAHK